MLDRAVRWMSALFALMLGLGATAVLTAPTAAADPNDEYSLFAELDRPHSEPGVGPKQYERTDVTEADGPELNGSHHVAGTGGATWDGDVEVVVDPAAQTITVRADGTPGEYERIVATIEFEDAYVTTVSAVSDTLLAGAGGTVNHAITHDNSSEVTISWDAGSPSGGPYLMAGEAVFSYTTIEWDDIPRAPYSLTVESPCVAVDDDYRFYVAMFSVFYQSGFIGNGYSVGLVNQSPAALVGDWSLQIDASGFHPIDRILTVVEGSTNDFHVSLIPLDMNEDCGPINGSGDDDDLPGGQTGGDPDTGDVDDTPVTATDDQLPNTGGPSPSVPVTGLVALSIGLALVALGARRRA